MTFPKFYVESDGDHVPKDVYICAGDGLGRVATVEGLSESTKFKVAHRIATACNTIDAVTAQRDALLATCEEASIKLREASGAFDFFAIQSGLCDENRATAAKASKETFQMHASLDALCEGGAK